MMASHETNGQSDEWYTPPWVFKALGVTFDLDPCCPHPNEWVPAKHYLTKDDDGLTANWHGSVWLNPPFGGRNAIRPWLEKLAEHGNGIAIVPNRTGTDWWQDAAARSSGLLFVRGKIKFLRPDGTEGGSPGYGNVLMSYGLRMAAALNDSAIRGLRSMNVQHRKPTKPDAFHGLGSSQRHAIEPLHHTGNDR